MSRVDEALRVWRRGNAVAAPEAEVIEPGPGHWSHFNAYPSEEPDRHAHAEPELPRPAELPHPVLRTSPGRGIRGQGATRYDADLLARLVTGTSSTVSLEQYRRLAAALHDWQIESQSKTVMITSALPQEGKTLTVVNLALTLSESYARRVLVIDADLRRPSLHTILEIPNDRGLSEALAEDHHELRVTEVSSRLSVVTAGHPGSSPLAGLTSSRMAGVLEECATRFDWVLIDTTPVGVLPDAQLLARLVGGIVLVIAAGSTPAAAVEQAIADIGGPEAIVGTVLNRVEDHRVPGADYYFQYKTARAEL